MNATIRKRISSLLVALTIVFMLNGVVSYLQLKGFLVDLGSSEKGGVKFIDWFLLSIALTGSPITMTYINISYNILSVMRGGGISGSSLYINMLFLFSVMYPLYWYFKNGRIVLLATSMGFIFAGGILTILIHI